MADRKGDLIIEGSNAPPEDVRYWFMPQYEPGKVEPVSFVRIPEVTIDVEWDGPRCCLCGGRGEPVPAATLSFGDGEEHPVCDECARPVFNWINGGE